MAQDERSVADQFSRRVREPHRPSVDVRVHGLLDEEKVRLIVREELERLLGFAIQGLSE